MLIVAAPNRQRSSPVAIARKCPVNIVIEPITIATRLDCFGVPISLLILANELIFNRCGADIPRRLCVIDKRSMATPAMWVLMLVRLMFVESTGSF